MSTFVELCCGSAALTVRLLGGKKPPAAYMGAKTAYVDDIVDALDLRGRAFNEHILVDVGPWADVWSALVQDGTRAEIAACIRSQREVGQRLFEAMAASTAEPGSVEWVAAYLILQTGNHQNKPVRWDDSWRTAGYGHLSQKAVARGFRARISVDALAAKIEKLPDLSRVRVIKGTALDVEPITGVVYLDPPYAGREGYGADDLGRDDVLALARRWSDAGATVAISEAEPLPLDGWPSVRLRRSTGLKRNFGKVEEWLTANRPVAVSQPPEQLLLLGEEAA